MNYSRNKQKTSLLNRKKTDPSKFSFTGKNTYNDISIQLFKYTKDYIIEETEISHIKLEKFFGKEFVFWLNVHGLSNTDAVVSLCQKQNIHNLVIQDILDVNQRPKFQEFEDFSFLTLKSIVPSENEMLTEQISFVFGEKFLISFQEKKADYFEHIRERLRDNKGIISERSADYLLYSMLESILDNYFKTISKLDQEIENLDFIEKKNDFSPNILAKIEYDKKFVNFIKKSILPIKEFTLTVERGECLNIEKRHLKYFMEIKDLCLTLLDSCDMLLTSLESKTNLFFSVQGHNMNRVMKTLTIVSTIFIPLTFIAGVYGMNFLNMPELAWKYGYFAILFIMIAIFIVMILYFKTKKWF